MSFRGIPGFGGIIGIVFGSLAVAALMSLVTGNHWHWPPILLSILVGWWAILAINR